MNLSVVIPVYNESENIKAAIQEILSASSKITDIDQIEVVVVDDRSSDNLYEAVSQIKNAAITYLRLSKRSGSHIALRAGIKEAKGDAVLCISADSQDDPSCIKNMLEKWNKGAKVVWALRKNRFAEAWYIRRLTEVFYRMLFWFTKTEYKGIDFSRADFFLLDREIINAINSSTERNTSLFGLIAWVGFNQDFVEYERRPRRWGQSKWSLRSRLHLAKDWIFAFSGLPLLLMSIFGVCIAISGVLYGIYLMIKTFTGYSVPGYSLVIVAILVVGGMQMIMSGIVGEYIWRNLDESRKRPLYFIEKRKDIDNV